VQVDVDEKKNTLVFTPSQLVSNAKQTIEADA
jgi:hypothetical protein